MDVTLSTDGSSDSSGHEGFSSDGDIDMNTDISSVVPQDKTLSTDSEAESEGSSNGIGATSIRIEEEEGDTRESLIGPGATGDSSDNGAWFADATSIRIEEEEGDTRESLIGPGATGDSSDNGAWFADVTQPGPSTSTPLKGGSRKKKRFQFFPHPSEVMELNCCPNKCTKKLTYLDIIETQGDWSDLNEARLKEEIFNNIKQHTKLVQVTRKIIKQEHTFIIRGKFVCTDAWRYTMNVRLAKFKDCVNRIMAGHKNVKHGNVLTTKRANLKTTEAHGWMQKKFDRLGDHMPDRNQIKLPQTWTKKRLWKDYQSSMIERGRSDDKIVSYTYFVRMWDRSFSNVKISDGSDFTKCSQCETIKDLIASSASEKTISTAKDILREHEAIVEAERAAYHSAREEATLQNSSITTIIIDGMDQIKTSLPHIVPKDKDTAHLAQLPTHVTGCLIHCCLPGSKVPLVFIDHKTVPHDPNLTIHVLLRALERHQGHLGRTLFLQLDNCFRENKNRYVLSFASLLVHFMVFEEVTIHFLPVGHTHEDIDQMFSRISVKLSKNQAYTYDDFKALVEDAYTPRIKVLQACPVYDVKKWMAPHLEKTFTGHTTPLWFRFRWAGGNVRMQWRKFVSTPWMPLPEYEDDGHTLTSESYGYQCMQSVPEATNVPDFVEPSLDKLDIEGLGRDLPKNYQHRLPIEAQNWWRDFVGNITSFEKLPEKDESWPLQNLVGQGRRPQEVVQLPLPVQRIQERQAEHTPEIRVGSQGKPPSRTAVQIVQDYESIQIGMLVAVNLADDSPPPYLGKVTGRSQNCITVSWLRGSYTGPWTEWYIGVGKSRKLLPPTEVTLESCLLWDFSLTSNNKLPGTVRATLKEKYDELRKNSEEEHR